MAGNPSSNILSFQKDLNGEYISVTCGKSNGKLYLDKLRNALGYKGACKCVYSNDQWISPCDFESLGGKPKNRNWKKSILFGDKPILSIFSDLCPTTSCRKSLSGTPVVVTNGLDSSQKSHTPPLLVNPVLAFVKAFRLKGDLGSLKSLVAQRFDFAMVYAALKALWAHCCPDLENLGLSFHSRRASDKSFELVFDDISLALEKLDLIDKLPSVYCEAVDLIDLPPLVPDPISNQIISSSKDIQSLSKLVKELPDKVTRPLLDQATPYVESLRSLLDTAQKLKDQLEASATKFKDNMSLASCVTDRVQPSSRAQSNVRLPLPDRKAYIILFGLSENRFLQETKSEVDSILQYLLGRSVPVVDAFRLGRVNPQSGSSSRPRPILIKLSSAWDKKLILSCKYKLKEYSTPNLFLREDVPFESQSFSQQSFQGRCKPF